MLDTRYDCFMKKIVKSIERAFEWLLWESRIIVIISVVASILSAIALSIVGTVDLFYSLKKIFTIFSDYENFQATYTKMLVSVVSAMDLYLIATVLLIFGIGLYELFISRIDQIEEEEKSSGILKVHSLDELKEKLLKVIHVVLVVYFFKYAIKIEYNNILDLLYLAIGIVLIAASIYLTGLKPGKSKKKHDDYKEKESH